MNVDTDSVREAGGAGGIVLTALTMTGHLDFNVILGTFAAVVFVTLIRPWVMKVTAAKETPAK